MPPRVASAPEGLLRLSPKESPLKYFRLFALLMLLVSVSVTSLSLGCRAGGEVSDDGIGAGVDLDD